MEQRLGLLCQIVLIVILIPMAYALFDQGDKYRFGNPVRENDKAKAKEGMGAILFMLAVLVAMRGWVS